MQKHRIVSQAKLICSNIPWLPYIPWNLIISKKFTIGFQWKTFSVDFTFRMLIFDTWPYQQSMLAHLKIFSFVKNSRNFPVFYFVLFYDIGCKIPLQSINKPKAKFVYNFMAFGLELWIAFITILFSDCLVWRLSPLW